MKNPNYTPSLSYLVSYCSFSRNFQRHCVIIWKGNATCAKNNNYGTNVLIYELIRDSRWKFIHGEISCLSLYILGLVLYLKICSSFVFLLFFSPDKYHVSYGRIRYPVRVMEQGNLPLECCTSRNISLSYAPFSFIGSFAEHVVHRIWSGCWWIWGDSVCNTVRVTDVAYVCSSPCKGFWFIN